MILTEHLPAAFELAELLEGLGARDCAAVEADPAAVEVDEPRVVALYRSRGSEAPAAAVVFDLPLAASLGAALVGIPPLVVDEAVADGSLEGSMAENLHEVANVLAVLLHSPATPSVALSGVTCPPGAAPVPQELAASGQCRSYRVSMRGYPGGTLVVHGTVAS